MATDKPKQLEITVLEEVHQTVRRRVAETAFISCCQEFEEEYGRQFRLLPGGGLVPAAARIERNKLGRIVLDQPKVGWKFCQFCGTQFVTNTRVVKKPVLT